MRKPATTPPVFDPRTINPNRVPTGLKVLIVASFMIAVGFGLVAPVLPNYAQNFNATVTMATMVVSALAITRLLFAPTAGKIITRFGERPVYTIGMLIVSVTSFMIAFAWDYWVLLAARAAAGIGSVMFTVSAMGLLVRLSLPICAAAFPVITRRRSCWATCWARSLRAPWLRLVCAHRLSCTVFRCWWRA